jgi:hypothetical protein
MNGFLIVMLLMVVGLVLHCTSSRHTHRPDRLRTRFSIGFVGQRDPAVSKWM